MKRRKPVEIKTYRVAGVESLEEGRAFKWSSGAWSGGAAFPVERAFAWNAEALGLHLWCDFSPEIGKSVRGWFSAGRVSTIAQGTGYVFSASRWLADPVETADHLAAFGAELQAGCHSLGINLKGSPGSAALAIFKNLSRGEKVDHATNAFAEQAIYGGRAELFRGGELEELSQWDRSAAYLAHLAEELPVPGTERWTAKGDLKLEGISEAVVEAEPNVCPVPCLPCHVEIAPGEHRTVYPWGRFIGRWPNVELRAALERGYRIRLRGGVTYGRMARRAELTRFVDKVWTARTRFPLAKRIGLALVGKLHEPRVTRLVEPGFGPFRTVREAKIAALRAGPGAIIVKHAHVVLPLRVREKFSWYVNMPLAAHILALGRLELLRFAEANRDRLCTLATDGAILTGWKKPSGVELGRDLGEWRRDYEADRGVIHGPLAYTLEAEGKAPKLRTAGVSRALAQKFLKGETVYWKSRAGLLARGMAGRTVKRRANARDHLSTQRTDELGRIAPPLVNYAVGPGGHAHNYLVEEDAAFPFPED